MYKRKIEKNNEMYLHSRYFFVSLHKSYIIMFKKLIKKIIPKPSVCYYSHLTQQGKRVTKIYLHGNLNKLELKHNLSANPNIKSTIGFISVPPFAIADTAVTICNGVISNL